MEPGALLRSQAFNCRGWDKCPVEGIGVNFRSLMASGDFEQHSVWNPVLDTSIRSKPNAKRILTGKQFKILKSDAKCTYTRLY